MADKLTGVKNETGIIQEAAVDSRKPSMYQVLMLNDDFTPMDFVVGLLKTYFNKNHEEALATMLKIHYKGEGKCGVYTREVAETKVMQVIDSARKNNHPLKCIMKKES